MLPETGRGSLDAQPRAARPLLIPSSRPTREFWISNEDLTTDEGWRLLSWCLSHGAEEFTLDFLPESGELVRWLLRPFWRRTAIRECMRNGPGREVDLFDLSEGSIPAMRTLLPNGLLSWWFSDYGSLPYVEDPAIYRRGELLVGVIAHDGRAAVRVTDGERAELHLLGVRPEPG